MYASFHYVICDLSPISSIDVDVLCFFVFLSFTFLFDSTFNSPRKELVVEPLALRLVFSSLNLSVFRQWFWLKHHLRRSFNEFTIKNSFFSIDKLNYRMTFIHIFTTSSSGQ
jgi:hypothetical protein